MMIEPEKIYRPNSDYPYAIWRIRIPGGWLYHIPPGDPVFVPNSAATKIEQSQFTPLTKKRSDE
jgi:hypothetical protein